MQDIRTEKLKIDKICDFSSDIDYNSETDVFRDVIYLIINQSEPRCPKDASSGQKNPHSASKRSALVHKKQMMRA